MQYTEFKRHLGKAGMTVNDFAAYLAIRPASVSNYSKPGAVPRSYAIIAILLGEAADHGTNFVEALHGFGVTPQTSSSEGNVKQLDMFRASRVDSAANSVTDGLAKKGRVRAASKAQVGTPS